MADSSLDDFFAKKDKSKKKSKVKSVEKDDAAKSQSTKKDKKKDKPTKISSQNSSTTKTQGERKPIDDEWNDFEEERAVDYSGLRIQNLQQKEVEEKDIEDDEEELDENGDVKEKKDKKEVASGPWKKGGGQTSASGPAAEEKKPAPTPANTGKYIPPSQRAAMANANRSTGMPGKRGKKELPNIRSDADFPTLSAMSIGQPSQQSNQYSQPQKSIQETTSTHHRAGGALTLENKFAVLQD